MQCRQVGKQISHHCKLKVDGLGVGRSLVEERKIVDDGVDVLIASHSRLQMQFEKRHIYLSNLKWLVIDEVDTLF